jgi:ankyrin repeat protein
LFEAVFFSNVEVVRLLLSAALAVDPNVGKSEGNVTPLIQAAIDGKVEILSALLEGGADPRLEDVTGHTAAMRVLYIEDESSDSKEAKKTTLRLLFLRKKSRDDKALPPVHVAVSTENIDLLKTYIGAGMDPTEAGPSGVTPLMAASKAKLTEIVEVLLTHPRVLETLDLQDDQGMTALMQAVDEGNETCYDGTDDEAPPL